MKISIILISIILSLLFSINTLSASETQQFSYDTDIKTTISGYGVTFSYSNCTTTTRFIKTAESANVYY